MEGGVQCIFPKPPSLQRSVSVPVSYRKKPAAGGCRIRALTYLSPAPDVIGSSPHASAVEAAVTLSRLGAEAEQRGRFRAVGQGRSKPLQQSR